MANTYHSILIHVVFAVKYRQSLIDKTWKSQLLGVIGTLVNEANCKTFIINGVEDHIHCLIGLRPSVAISELMKSVKAKSSKYINDHGLTKNRFEWQEGYGVFSYSYSDLDKVYKYIVNQEEHHKKFSFQNEYQVFLKEFNIDFQKQFTFHEPI
ncbi:MAG: IS200/IS605 family transposase [Saprospiraceae bacterium]